MPKGLLESELFGFEKEALTPRAGPTSVQGGL